MCLCLFTKTKCKDVTSFELLKKIDLVEFLKENLIFNVLISLLDELFPVQKSNHQPLTYLFLLSYQPIAYIPLFFNYVSFMPLIHF